MEREQRGEIERHFTGEETGLMVRVFPEDGHGFLRSLVGQEEYLHRNGVLPGDFDRPPKGTRAHFASEGGDKGLQASSLLY